MKTLVLYYSAFGHMHKMAEAVARGVSKVPGAEAVLKRVPETLPEQLLDRIGITQAQKAFEHIPIADVLELKDYDAILFGTPTRFGNMCAQMRVFLDGAGPLWTTGELVGKPAGVFTSSATQHGGQESTILTFIPTLLHLGFIYVGLPYAWQGQMRLDEITGGSPYGASTIAGGEGQRQPSENELEGAAFQGRYVAEIASKLAGK
jgi:NAD(P)H dehydrogenase (quinone)